MSRVRNWLVFGMVTVGLFAVVGCGQGVQETSSQATVLSTSSQATWMVEVKPYRVFVPIQSMKYIPVLIYDINLHEYVACQETSAGGDGWGTTTFSNLNPSHTYRAEVRMLVQSSHPTHQIWVGRKEFSYKYADQFEGLPLIRLVAATEDHLVNDCLDPW